MLVHCRNEFFTHQTGIFLVIYYILDHEKILTLLNKITGFEHIRGSQYILDRKNDNYHLCLASNLVGFHGL